MVLLQGQAAKFGWPYGEEEPRKWSPLFHCQSCQHTPHSFKCSLPRVHAPEDLIDGIFAPLLSLSIGSYQQNHVKFVVFLTFEGICDSPFALLFIRWTKKFWGCRVARISMKIGIEIRCKLAIFLSTGHGYSLNLNLKILD